MIELLDLLERDSLELEEEDKAASKQARFGIGALRSNRGIFGSAKSSTVLAPEGFKTTQAGLELIDLLSQSPSSSFKANDFKKLVGFNVRPLPANYNELTPLEQEAINEDRFKSISAEKGRISRLRTDIVEGLQLESQGLQPQGQTLRTLEERIKLQQKVPSTIGQKIESVGQRPGRAIRGFIGELMGLDPTGEGGVTPIKAVKEAFSLPISQTRKFDAAEQLRKIGFKTRTLSEIFETAFSEDGKGIKFKRGGIWDISGEGVAGFAADVFTDPYMYLTGGVSRALPLLKFAGKGFTPAVEELGKVGVYLNKKGLAEYSRLSDELLATTKSAGQSLSERQIMQKVSPQMYAKYGKNFERGQDLIDQGGLKLGVPFSPDLTTKSIIKHESFVKFWNGFTKFVPESLRNAVSAGKNEFARVWLKIFGGEGATLEPAIKDAWVADIGAGTRIGQEQIRRTQTDIFMKYMKDGGNNKNLTVSFGELALNMNHQVVQRGQYIHKALQETLKSLPKNAVSENLVKRLAQTSSNDLGEMIKLAKSFEHNKIISSAQGLIDQAGLDTFAKTVPLNLNTVTGMNNLNLEQIYINNIENLQTSLYKAYTDLNPGLLYEGGYRNYLTGLEINKAMQQTGGATLKESQVIGTAINSLKRTKGINSENMYKEAKRLIAENAPEKELVKFNHDVIKGMLHQESAINAATHRLMFQKYVGDIYKHLPEKDLVPLQLVQGSKAVMVPKDVHTRIMNEFARKSVSIQDDFLKWYRALGAEAATNIWKIGVTVMYPVFHIRNNVTDFINAFTDRGLAVFLNHKETMQIMGNKQGALPVYGSSKNISYDAIRKDLKDSEIGAGIKVETSADDISDILFADSFPGAKLTKRLAETTPIKIGMAVTEFSENYWRINTYLHTLRKTGSMSLARDMANKYHANYRQILSPFERKVVKRILPFYTFSKHNIPLQIKNWMEHPGLTKFPVDVINAASDEMLDEDLQAMPQWMMGRFILKTGIDASGRGEFMSFSGIPTEEAFGRFFTGDKDGNLKLSDIFLKSVGGLLNPLIKFPVEQLMDRSLFFGGKIRGNGIEIVYDKPPQIISTILKKLDQVQPESAKALRSLLMIKGPAFNVKSGKEEFSMNPIALHILQTLPISRFIGEASRLTNEDLTTLQNLTGSLSNVSFTNLDVPTKIEVKEQKQRGDLLSILEQQIQTSKNTAIQQGIEPPPRPSFKKKRRSLF